MSCMHLSEGGFKAKWIPQFSLSCLAIGPSGYGYMHICIYMARHVDLEHTFCNQEAITGLLLI